MQPDSPAGQTPHAAPVAIPPPLALLACPVCHGQLEHMSGGAACLSCSAGWPSSQGYLDFRVGSEADDSWASRQRDMEDWYGELVADPIAASACLLGDYRPLASRLGAVAGAVLDIGGGFGVTRDFLPAATRYVDVDPSDMWLGARSAALATRFASMRQPLCFVRGYGEHLPFRPDAFDAALAIFSLNHAAKPERVVAEAQRVLRPGGRFLIVLEDSTPRLSDLLRPQFLRRPRRSARAAVRMFVCAISSAEWPIQSDHVRVDDRALVESASPGLRLTERVWLGDYLFLELVKCDS